VCVCVCRCQEYARGGGTVENWAVPAVVYSLVSRCLRDGVSLLLNLVCMISNSNSNGGTCIAPPTRRPRVHHRVSPYHGAHKQNETEMFSDHNGTSPSIAAVFSPLAACSMLVVQQQKGSVANSSTCPRHDEVAT